jgi:transposase
MESTGVLWKPIWNILEGEFELLLVNPRTLKRVPGRKSDVRDCQWIAQLLHCGLLRSSFVPPRPQRELRDLTRYRAQLASEHTRVVNRIHKTLADTNIKLGAVASDIMGKSSRAPGRPQRQKDRGHSRLARQIDSTEPAVPRALPALLGAPLRRLGQGLSALLLQDHDACQRRRRPG